MQNNLQALKLPGVTGDPIEGPKGSPGTVFDPDNKITLASLISDFLPLIFWAAGIALFGYLMYGGFKYLTSLGDEQAIEEAKGTVTNALIGFILVFAAFFIARFISGFLGTGGGL